MTIRKSIIGIAALTAISLFTSLANAKPSIDHRLQKMTQRLELTEQQQQQIRSIMEAAKAQHEELLSNYGVDESVRKQLRDIRRNSASDISAVLTKEQRQKFKFLRKMHRPVESQPE